MNCQSIDTPTSMKAQTPHAPIVEAIARGDVATGRSVVEQHVAIAAEHAPDET